MGTDVILMAVTSLGVCIYQLLLWITSIGEVDKGKSDGKNESDSILGWRLTL